MKNPSHGLSENASYKIVALLITLILWVIILGSKEASVDKKIPTRYLLSEDAVIVNTVPQEVSFHISGPRLTLKRFTESVEPLSIDLTSAMEGLTTIRIHPDSIDVPPGLHVTSVSPATITPKIEKLVTRRVSIKIQLIGQLPAKHRLMSAIVTPAIWEIVGIRSSVEGIQSLRTEPIDVSNFQSSLTKEVNLIIDDPGIVRKKDARVRVELVIK